MNVLFAIAAIVAACVVLGHVLAKVFPGKAQAPVSPDVAWFTLKQGADALTNYPSTVGDKLRWLSEAERFAHSYVTANPVNSKHLPQQDELQSVLAEIDGTHRQCDSLVRNGRTQEANEIARRAITRSYEHLNRLAEEKAEAAKGSTTNSETAST